jgi:hypothetical protein
LLPIINVILARTTDEKIIEQSNETSFKLTKWEIAFGSMTLLNLILRTSAAIVAKGARELPFKISLVP